MTKAQVRICRKQSAHLLLYQLNIAGVLLADNKMRLVLEARDVHGQK